MRKAGSRRQVTGKEDQKFCSLDMIVHIFNTRTQEAVASGSLGVQGQPDLHKSFRLVRTVFQTTEEKRNHLMAGEVARWYRGYIVLPEELSQISSTVSDSPSSDAFGRWSQSKRQG